MDTKDRLDQLNDALKQVVSSIVIGESNLRDLKDQELFIAGQIAQRELNKGPEPIAQLPIHRSTEELLSALDERDMSVFGEGEMLKQRQEVLEREAQRKADFINDSVD